MNFQKSRSHNGGLQKSSPPVGNPSRTLVSLLNMQEKPGQQRCNSRARQSKCDVG